MDKIIKESIKESWCDYQDATIDMDENEHWAHEHGWKDGYEWILSELRINNEISDDIFDKYMNKELVWTFKLFGVEIGWCKHRQCEWFSYIESYELFYFRKLRIWFYKQYYENEYKQ